MQNQKLHRMYGYMNLKTEHTMFFGTFPQELQGFYAQYIHTVHQLIGSHVPFQRKPRELEAPMF